MLPCLALGEPQLLYFYTLSRPPFSCFSPPQGFPLPLSLCSLGSADLLDFEGACAVCFSLDIFVDYHIKYLIVFGISSIFSHLFRLLFFHYISQMCVTDCYFFSLCMHVDCRGVAEVEWWPQSAWYLPSPPPSFNHQSGPQHLKTREGHRRVITCRGINIQSFIL